MPDETSHGSRCGSLGSDDVSIRLRSMHELRSRLEDLASQHRDEEQGLRETVTGLLRQTEGQHERMIELERSLSVCKKQLRHAQEEKLKAVEMVDAFKGEGEAIMAKLKHALRDAHQQCEEEKRKKADIAQHFNARLEEYKELLEAQEKSASQLRAKNSQLEMKLKAAERMIQDISASDTFNQNYVGVHSQLKGVDRVLSSPKAPAVEVGEPDGDAPRIQHKVRLQDQIIHMLYAKLKTEQNHRLETEEQAARMVAAEEYTIRKLEDKLRDAENDRDRSVTGTPRAGTPRALATPRASRMADLQQTVATSASRTAMHSDAPFTTYTALPELQFLGAAATPAESVDPQEAASPSPMKQPPSNNLEMQLAEVTKDFNESLTMWSSRLHASGGLATPRGGRSGSGPSAFTTPAGRWPQEKAQRRSQVGEPSHSPQPASEVADYLPDSPDPVPHRGNAVFNTPPLEVAEIDFLPDSPAYPRVLPIDL